MQKKLIEAKKKFDERRREQSLSPQKDHKAKATKNISPRNKSQKKSEKNLIQYQSQKYQTPPCRSIN